MTTVLGMRVLCPGCETILQLPEGFTGSKIRCGSCGTPFRLPRISDADILEVIGRRDLDDTARPGDDEPLPEEIDAVVRDTHPSADEAVTGPFATGIDGFELVHVDPSGALFEIDAELLKSEAFRSSMPRRCLRCGAKTHLQPHPVIFSHSMLDSASIETEYASHRPDLSANESMNLPIADVMVRMGQVSRVPEPANEPLPYWICDMCSPADMIFACNEISHESHTGHVHLQIKRLWRAAEFLQAAGGKDSPADHQMQRIMEKNIEKPWDQLAGVVQQRLRQWFRPNKGEHFVAFMPIHTRLRTEKGMAGVVVSNRRLIYHHSMRHRESDKGEPIELTFAMDAGHLRLNIKGSNWQLKNLHVDKAGLEVLRRALLTEKFNAVWH